MRISAEDMRRLLNPVLRDPEVERRRLIEIGRVRRLGPFTPERLREGIPVPGLTFPKRTGPEPAPPAPPRPADPPSDEERRLAVVHAVGSLKLDGFEISPELEQHLYEGIYRAAQPHVSDPE